MTRFYRLAALYRGCYIDALPRVRASKKLSLFCTPRSALHFITFISSITHGMTSSANSTNPIVNLEPNSLYVGTSQLFANEGTFHWAIYITDANGVAMKLQWSASPNFQTTGFAEAVSFKRIEVIRTRAANRTVYGIRPYDEG
ncbi:hypothetical protein BDQ17DRAFT_1435343 [Cyathus striatus]|nr:hypothetical protein BDQ17DRAFT_1435343 [Cyathus striatus]